MLKPLHKLLVPVFLLTLSGVKAQTINYTSTPATSAIENVAFTTSIAATISNNDGLSYSAPTLPSWLTLSSGGATSGTKINNTVIPAASGVAGDANGNFYVVQRDQNQTGIYKIAPDGTTTLWASKRANCNNYGAIVIGNYLYVSYYSGTTPGIEKFNITDQNPTGTMIQNTHGFLSMTYKDGYLYAANHSYSKVGRINIADDTYSEYIPSGATYAFGLDFTPSGDLLVASHNMRKVMKYSNGVITDVLTDLPTLLTDVKVDANGYVYVSFWGGKIRKYTPDLSSFIEVSGSTNMSMGMTLTATGTLIYGDCTAGNVYTLQTGATLTGTPSHNDVGVHPVKVVVTNGTVSKELEFSITVSDPNPPTIATITPAHNGTDIALKPTLKLAFTEDVVKNEGKIFIKAKSDNSILATIDIASSNVSFSNNEFTITVNDKLPSLTDVYVEVEAGVVKDPSGNAFPGISGNASWAFKTIEQTQSEQTITFASTKTVSYGTADFEPGASSDAGLDIIYTSSDESVAAIVDGKIKVKKAGVTTITASQAGNENYLPAIAATQELTVTKRDLVITASNITKVYGSADPALTYESSPLKNGDEITGSLTREEGNNAGEYNINLGSVSAGPNYEIQFTAGKLTITPASLTIKAEDKSRAEGKENPEFTFTYNGFVNGDNAADLAALPQGQTTANSASAPGVYDITVAGANASNYTITYVGGKLTVVAVDKQRMKAWSPSQSVLQVRIYVEIAQKAVVTLYTDAGQPIVLQRHQLNVGVNTFTIPVGNLASNIYILHVNADKFKESQRVKIK